MPYPNQYHRGITTPDSKLQDNQTNDPNANSLGGNFVGNAHTFRVTANGAGMVGGVHPPYDYGWTPVTFNGTDTYLANPTNIGWLTSPRIIAVARVWIDAYPAGPMTLIGHTTGGVPLGLLNILANGAIQVQTPTNFSSNGFVGETAPATMPIKQWVTLHLHAFQGAPAPDADSSGNVLLGDVTRRVWLTMNGLAASIQVTGNGNRSVPASQALGPNPVDQGLIVPGGWFTSALTNFLVPTAWSIGATPTGTQKFAGRMSMVWVALDGNDAALPSLQEPGSFTPIRPMGAQLANPGARPSIGFGVVQTAANWNAGTNLGDGTGTWTMNGAVT